jgi:hypothetical protein
MARYQKMKFAKGGGVQAFMLTILVAALVEANDAAAGVLGVVDSGKAIGQKDFLEEVVLREAV